MNASLWLESFVSSLTLTEIYGPLVAFTFLGR